MILFIYPFSHGSFFSVYSYPELFNSYNMNVRAFWVDADGKKVIGTPALRICLQ